MMCLRFLYSLMLLLYFSVNILFIAFDLWAVRPADTQHEDREDRKFSLVPGPKLPEEVHGAPPDSFVAQLAEIMAGIKTEQGMGEFWLEVIKEVTPLPVISDQGGSSGGIFCMFFLELSHL